MEFIFKIMRLIGQLLAENDILLQALHVVGVIDIGFDDAASKGVFIENLIARLNALGVLKAAQEDIRAGGFVPIAHSPYGALENIATHCRQRHGSSGCFGDVSTSMVCPSGAMTAPSTWHITATTVIDMTMNYSR